MDDMPSDPNGDLRRENEQLRRELDSITAKLCKTLASLSPAARAKLPDDTKQWYSKHEAFDKKRLAKEKIKEDIAELHRKLKDLE